MSEEEVRAWVEIKAQQQNPYIRDHPATQDGYHEKCGDRIWRSHLRQEFELPLYSPVYTRIERRRAA